MTDKNTASSNEMGIQEAFDTLVHSPYFWSLTGKEMSQRRKLAYKLKNGEGISLDKKLELLKLAGFVIKQDIILEMPSFRNER